MKRFVQTDFAVNSFNNGWMSPGNMSEFAACLYELRTRKKARSKEVYAGGVHYPTLIVANHLNPPVSTSGAQWCWLDGRGVGSNGLSRKTCCDASRGPRGLESCWDDYFSFELCCLGDVSRGELPHFFVAPAFDINVGNAVRQVGTFDLGQSYAMQTLCRDGDTVLDIGANVGGFTVPLAERVGQSGEVHAFEPFRKVYQHLNANVALNGLSNVYTYNVALGAKHDELRINAPDLTTWNFPSAIRVSDQIAPEKSVEQANLHYERKLEKVLVRPLDSYEFDGRVKLIKIDVEFMELQVVLGARETIRKHQPVMWVENEPFFDEPPNREFVDTMQKEFNYACRAIARLELLCAPGGGMDTSNTLPKGFNRVFRHLSGEVKDASLWRALSEVDPEFTGA